MNEPIQDGLRRFARELRRSSMSLADLIPLLQQAADRIDQLEKERSPTHAVGFVVAANTPTVVPFPLVFTTGEQHCAQVFNNN